MTNVYITHGYGANREEHWFPWLEQKLEAQGIHCHRLNMPETDTPTPEVWLAHHQANVTLDENTILIGHSLGCIATLNFLASQQKKIKGVILVAGFYQPVPDLPELDCFANFYAKLTACLPEHSAVIASLDDHIVPHTLTDNLAQHLKADYIRFPTGGHFLGEEGMTELPIVLELIEHWIKK